MWAEIKQYWLVALMLLLVVTLLALCTGTKEKLSYQDKANQFCQSLDSVTLYANEDKKLVICK